MSTFAKKPLAVVPEGGAVDENRRVSQCIFRSHKSGTTIRRTLSFRIIIGEVLQNIRILKKWKKNHTNKYECLLNFRKIFISSNCAISIFIHVLARTYFNRISCNEFYKAFSVILCKIQNVPSGYAQKEYNYWGLSWGHLVQFWWKIQNDLLKRFEWFFR